jgi:hypothetical protein
VLLHLFGGLVTFMVLVSVIKWSQLRGGVINLSQSKNGGGIKIAISKKCARPTGARIVPSAKKQQKKYICKNS